MKKITKFTALLSIIILSSFIFSACGKKPIETQKTEPTPISKLVELTPEEKPYISLIPREDGHSLKLKITKIPSFVTQIEYELVYTAIDNGLEIEKGAGDTIKVDSTTLERDILLGTASCTNGCKYKYDEGVTGGMVSLTLDSENGQVSTIESPFTLKSTIQLKKDSNNISIKDDSFSTKVTTKANEFYVLIKNALVYSLFSSKGLVNDYPINQ